MLSYISILTVILAVTEAGNFDYKSLNLPDNHIPYHFNKFPELKESCLQDDKCPYKVSTTFNIMFIT